MSQRLISLLGTLFLAVTLAACSTDTSPASPSASADAASPDAAAPPSNTVSADGAAAKPAQEASPRTYTDLYGEVSIPADPQRVLVTSSRYAEYLASMGEAPDMVLYTSSVEPEYRTQYLQEQGVEIIEYPQYEHNFELLLSLAPDLIVAPGISVDESTYEQMTKIAPTVALDSTVGMEESMPKLAQLFDKQSESDAEMAAYHAKTAEAASQLEQALGDRTVLVLRVEAKQYRYLGDDEQRGGAIKLLYHDLGLNVPPAIAGAEDWFTPFSLEFLPEIDPDYILLEQRVVDGEDGTEFYDQLMKSSLWKGLRAVKEGHVIPVTTQDLVQGEGPIGYANFTDELVKRLTALQ
ncbi:MULTISPECIES: ABC transporter substrate-binding protein [Saccharibacillus]|uniref:ABC transporter substrate-binding protein n=1 Tax=Saccharibacillus TaxID=456492 RepID=UPI0012391EF5|nr:ABC transporter substrate-binding protein [Saccharibacillus sp. WB 17]MWJ33217.1 ABC transporter substrate-binding protein [Saccharibacillus sp. WB 17]